MVSTAHYTPYDRLFALLPAGRRRICADRAFMAFALLHALFQRYALPLPVKCIAGALVITAIEFIAGYIVNLRMGLNVWDYSGRPYNLYRQICPGFALLWALLSLPIALLCDHIIK